MTDRSSVIPIHVEEQLSPMGKAMEGIRDVFAEFERSMIRTRTKGTMQMKRRRGERVGTVPYGYRLAVDGVHLTLAFSQDHY